MEALAQMLRTNEEEGEPPGRRLALGQRTDQHTSDTWNDWRWQLRNRVTTLEELERHVNLTAPERHAIQLHGGNVPLAITPYYLKLVDRNDAVQPIRRTVIPTLEEFVHSACEAEDPLNEDEDSPVPGIVHRYPDRALFLVTNNCSTYCRYCTRSRVVSDSSCRFNEEKWQRGLDYIGAHPEIRDVLISGGDPLTLPDDRIEWLLVRLRRFDHVEFIRMGTKAPVVLPQRVTPGLCSMLKKYHPLWMSIHFAHPDELTPECQRACNMLADAGIPLGSQTVLLKGINDSVEVMKRLVHALLKVRVRPYYIYALDRILGSSHFASTIDKGIEIIRGLRGWTTGYAVPTFVIDAPGGGGKIPITPDYVHGHDSQGLALTNYEGRTFHYPD